MYLRIYLPNTSADINVDKFADKSATNIQQLLEMEYNYFCTIISGFKSANKILQKKSANIFPQKYP